MVEAREWVLTWLWLGEAESLDFETASKLVAEEGCHGIQASFELTLTIEPCHQSRGLAPPDVAGIESRQGKAGADRIQTIRCGTNDGCLTDFPQAEDAHGLA